jgi:hypothetical protein
MHRVRCRIRETYTVGRTGDQHRRTFTAGEEIDLYQGEDDPTLWWTAPELAGAYVLPAPVVQPLDERR